jgi:hypothetical protein
MREKRVTAGALLRMIGNNFDINVAKTAICFVLTFEGVH